MSQQLCSCDGPPHPYSPGWCDPRPRSLENRGALILEVLVTQEEYTEISRAASWEGKSVERYLVDEALGKGRKGC